MTKRRRQKGLKSLPNNSPPPPLPVDDFRHTDDYRRYLAHYIDPVSLMSLRVVDKAWQIVVDQRIDGLVKGGSLLVHGGNDISHVKADALEERRKNVMDVVFLLNITTIGEYACCDCESLVTVVVPEGIESIGDFAFADCTSLLNVTFPKSLKSIGRSAFYNCTSIEAMDLSHTLLNSIGEWAFSCCSELKSLKLPSSVQSAGDNAFWDCSKLVPSTISTSVDASNTPILAFLPKPQSERDALMLANPPIDEDSEDSDIDDDEGDY
jgi:hypothetical protein